MVANITRITMRFLVLVLLAGIAAQADDGLRASPQTVLLDSPEASQQLLAIHRDENRRSIDLTRCVQ